METTKLRTKIEQLASFTDLNITDVKILSCGVTSLLIALYRVKPFTRFQKPHDLPNHFIRNKFALEGTVKRIEPGSTTLLMVEHKPLIPLPHIGRKKYLPIKVAGVDITSNGVSWLQTIVNGNRIMFVPLSKEQQYLECLITLPQPREEVINIGKELLKLGFATTAKLEQTLLKDKSIVAYQNSLLSAQKLAKRKRNGYWHFKIYPTFLWNVQHFLNQQIKKILPSFIVKQLNI